MTGKLYAILLTATFILNYTSGKAVARPTVAVLDTGCSIESVQGVSFTRTSPFIDTCGHGTLMARVILDSNPDINLIMVKIADTRSDFKARTITRGLLWCLENNVDIVNLSFTIEDSASVRSAINQLIDAGITVVAAVGNTNTSTGFVIKDNLVYKSTRLDTAGFPANMDSVIGVGALNFWGVKADFARSCGEVATNGKWAMKSGTSISSARLTAYISIIAGQHPDLDSHDIRKIIRIIAQRKKNNLFISKKIVKKALKENIVASLEPEYQLAMNVQ